jgi:hypothetical protein
MTNDRASLLVAFEHHDIFQKMGQAETLSQADQFGHSLIFAIDEPPKQAKSQLAAKLIIF